jgi:hypothetical protein
MLVDGILRHQALDERHVGPRDHEYLVNLVLRLDVTTKALDDIGEEIKPTPSRPS